MLRRWIKSAGVWYAYYPHMTMMRMLGPRASLVLARVLGWAHGLLARVGGQKRVRRAMEQALRDSRPDLNVSAELRRYLQLKQQRFAEWYTYPTRRGRRFVERTYRTVEGHEHLESARAEGKGMIVLVFHFGLAKMVWPALKSLGFDNHHHVFRGATYAGQTVGWIAQAAMNKLAQSEEQSGLHIIYHRPFFTFEIMYRLLQKNAVVGMNGDGMMGTDFVDLPFLGGTMPFPAGPARLAARAGAPILSVYCLPEGLTGHRLIVHPPIRCAADVPEEVNATVGSYVALLDDYVHRYPWAWWTWRRLDVARAGDGQVNLTAHGLATEDGLYHRPASGPASGPAKEPATAR